MVNSTRNFFKRVTAQLSFVSAMSVNLKHSDIVFTNCLRANELLKNLVCHRRASSVEADMETPEYAALLLANEAWVVHPFDDNND